MTQGTFDLARGDVHGRDPDDQVSAGLEDTIAAADALTASVTPQVHRSWQFHQFARNIDGVTTN
jgi:hypothetical protein